MERSDVGFDPKTIISRLNIRDTLCRLDAHADSVRLPQQRVQDGLCSVGGWEKLAVLLGLEVYTDFSKKQDGLIDGEGRQDALDDFGVTPAEVRHRDIPVRHVAPSATGNQYLGAEFARTVQHNDRHIRRRAGGEDGRRQPSGTTTDNDYVNG